MMNTSIQHKDKRRKKPLIKDTCPELMAQFNPELNPGVDINKISEGSGIKIIWQCVDFPEHTWKVNTNNRVYYKAFGCPECNGSGGDRDKSKLKDKAEKLLFVAEPDLFLQLDTRKNTEHDLTRITIGSGIKLIWTCDVCQHSWKKSPAQRVINNSGCPECEKSLKGAGSSKLETQLYSIFKSNPYFFSTAQGEKTGVFFGSGHECSCDITTVVKSTQRIVLFELDGEYWHEDKLEQDSYKTKKWLESMPGALVVRVRTGNLKFLDIEHDNLLQLRLEKMNYPSLEEVVNEVIKKLEE